MATTYDSKQRKLTRRTYKAYRDRIEELRGYGEDEGVTVNEASEKDFWAFVKSLSASRKGSLVLMDNGNLRALWKGEQESHLGLQFLGDRMVELRYLQAPKKGQEGLKGGRRRQL